MHPAVVAERTAGPAPAGRVPSSSADRCARRSSLPRRTQRLARARRRISSRLWL